MRLATEAAASASGLHYLYRWFDKDGVLLYVGISTEPLKRERDHWLNSWWSHFASVVAVDAEPCADGRAEAERIELETIRAEAPMFNRAGLRVSIERVMGYIAGRGHDPADYSRRMPTTSVGDVDLQDAARARLRAYRDARTDRDPAVIAAHEADLPITEIAALSGLSRQWVARILKTAQKQNGEQS